MARPREDMRRLWAEDPARFLFTAGVMALLVGFAVTASVVLTGGLIWLLTWAL